MASFLRKLALAVTLGVATTATVPHRIAGWEADSWFEGDAALMTMRSIDSKDRAYAVSLELDPAVQSCRQAVR